MNGWVDYDAAGGPIGADVATAHEVRPGTGTAEAATLHFYASRIRGDAAWREALDPPAGWDDTLRRKLEQLDGWRIERVALVARKDNPNKVFVKVDLDFSIGEKSWTRDRHTVTLARRGERWVITRPPT